jgi:hypothetical protein
MIILCIRYTIDQNKVKDFEEYARRWPGPIKCAGGDLIGYFLPTKIAGSTNFGLALIDFSDLDAYEEYREAITQDPEAKENIARIEASGCLLNEDRAFVKRVGD